MPSVIEEYLCILQSSNVTITAGQGENTTTFTVPKALLCSATWFDSALKSHRFIEGQEGCIALPEDPVYAVEAFIYFLYTDSVVLEDFAKEPDGRDLQLLEVVQNWTFADKYMLPVLQNYIVHRICAILDGTKFGRGIDPTTLTEFYRAVTVGSPIRQLITDYIVHQLEAQGDEFKMDDSLPGCEGFFADFHASEKAMHKHPGDFPRYKKPKKHSKLLAARGPNGDRRGTWCGLDFRRANHDCNECGFMVSVTPFCRNCVQTYCLCGKTDWMLICNDCAGTLAQAT